MRPAKFVRRLLHPGGFIFETVIGPVGLHIDRLGDAGACEIGEILLDRIVAPDRLIGAEDARLHRPGQPGQVRLTPDVMMCVDERAHAAPFPSDNRCETTAAVDPPSTRSSTKRWIAISASVCGVKPGPVASGVSQLTRQARRDSFATASRRAETSPRSKPSEMMMTAAPRA